MSDAFDKFAYKIRFVNLPMRVPVASAKGLRDLQLMGEILSLSLFGCVVPW